MRSTDLRTVVLRSLGGALALAGVIAGAAIVTGGGAAHAGGGDFTIDFAAVRPDTYNHATGGPQKATDFADKVESLEGGDFACGDKVAFLAEITVDAAAAESQDIEISFRFTGESTGQPGVGFDDLVSATSNIDSVTDGDETVGVISGATNDPPADLTPTVQITGLEAGEVFVLRLVVNVSCTGETPTGNLQGAAMSASVVAPADDGINLGNQTVPLQLGGPDGQLTGAFQIEKQRVGGLPTDTFSFGYDCDDGTTGTLQLTPSTGTATSPVISGIPVGTSCTVTEDAAADYTTTPSVSQTIVIGTAPVVNVQFVNIHADPTPPDITVTKTAASHWIRTYDWDIDKSFVSATAVTVDGVMKARVVYNLVPTRLDAAAVDTYSVSGTITVTNGNDTPATVTAVDDQLPGFTCLVDPLPTAAVTSTSGVTLDYVCAPDNPSTFTPIPTVNSAKVDFSWAKTIGAGTGNATGTADVTYSATPDELVDDTATVADDKYPGPLSATATNTYSILVDLTVANCTTGFTNTASVTGADTGAVLGQDSVTVKVCPTIGGRTIGYWSSKNGTPNGSKNWPLVRSQYSNILTAAPLSTSTTWAQVQTFLTARTTNCSGECKTMLQAQFIATALNAKTITGFGDERVSVPNYLDTDGTPDNCTTVTNLLAAINTQYPFGSTAIRTEVKTILDRLNQDVSNQLQCVTVI